MRSGIIVVLCLATAVCAVRAQDGTPLSAEGAGIFTSFAGSRSAGMGNSGLALSGNGYLSLLNPASWSGLESVQITAAFGFSGVSSQDNKMGQTSYYANGNFNGGTFALPIDRGLGISIAGGFAPLTSYQYQIVSTVPDTSGIPTHTYLRTGAGGLGEGFFGGTVSPIKELNLGAMFQYAFGRTELTGQIIFDSSGYENSYLDNSMYLRGPAGTIGFQAHDLDQLSGWSFLKGLSIGGYYRGAFDLNGTSAVRSIYAADSDYTFTSGAAGRIPPEYGLGIADKISDELTALLDFRLRKLSQYYDTFTSAGTLKDALFLGGGVEYLAGRSIATLFQRRVLRAGFYYQETQFEVPTRSGQLKQLDELFLTAGIEMPISVTASIDLSAQYGLRGISSDFLFREHVFRLYLSITMGEVWFSRPEGE